MKKVLITGVAGFIGSHLADVFLEKGFKVIGIDNFITGLKENIKHLLNNKKFQFINHDICNEIVINSDLDCILHFASPASPKDYLKYPIKTLQIGSLGTENILKLGIKKKAKVLVASTSEIYGDPILHPQDESYFGNVNPIGPRGVYDEAKRYLEALTMAYHRKENLDIRIVRIFNTFGPRMRVNDGRAIPNFLNQSLNNKNFTVYGDGSQTRSFCYIDDLIKGVTRLIDVDYQNPINLGNPQECSIIELIELIKEINPSSSKISFFDLPENDPKVRNPDITLAKKLLNFNPNTSLKDGLVKTLEYFKNYNYKFD